MNMEEKRQKNIIRRAVDSKCLDELWDLHESKIMNVRRAVARNKNISTEIANKLAHDPVLNVSYMAVQNPKSTINREFSESLHACVLCEKDEHTIVCEGCENLN